LISTNTQAGVTPGKLSTPEKTSTPKKRKIDCDDDFIPLQDSDSGEEALAQTQSPALKPKRTKRQSLEEEAWRPSDGEASDEGQNTITTRSTRATNIDQYFVTPIAGDVYTCTLPRRTPPKSKGKTSRHQSRDITPTKGLSKSIPVMTSDSNTTTTATATPVLTYSVKPRAASVGQPKHATCTTLLTCDAAIETGLHRGASEQHHKGNKEGYQDSGELNVKINNPPSMIGDTFPAGIDSWDNLQLSLSIHLKYLDGEIRKYKVRYLERTIEYVGSEPPTNPSASPSPWRELDIPTISIPYLMHFFEAPAIPGRNPPFHASRCSSLTADRLK
jgi:hypothetical protein